LSSDHYRRDAAPAKPGKRYTSLSDAFRAIPRIAGGRSLVRRHAPRRLLRADRGARPCSGRPRAPGPWARLRPRRARAAAAQCTMWSRLFWEAAPVAGCNTSMRSRIHRAIPGRRSLWRTQRYGLVL